MSTRQELEVMTHPSCSYVLASRRFGGMDMIDTPDRSTEILQDQGVWTNFYESRVYF